MERKWTITNFLLEESGKELLQFLNQHDYSFNDFLWLLNLCLCSKEFDDPDIPKLNSLLIEINPYLLVNDLDYPNSYKTDAINFLKLGQSLENYDKYRDALKNLLNNRVSYCKQVIPNIYKEYKKSID